MRFPGFCLAGVLTLVVTVGCGTEKVQVPTKAVLYDESKDKAVFLGGSKDMKKGKGNLPASGSPPG